MDLCRSFNEVLQVCPAENRQLFLPPPLLGTHDLTGSRSYGGTQTRNASHPQH